MGINPCIIYRWPSVSAVLPICGSTNHRPCTTEKYPCFRVFLWLSRFRISRYHCSSSDPCCGMGLIPGPGTSTCYGRGQKKKKKRQEKIPIKGDPASWNPPPRNFQMLWERQKKKKKKKKARKYSHLSGSMQLKPTLWGSQCGEPRSSVSRCRFDPRPDSVG